MAVKITNLERSGSLNWPRETIENSGSLIDLYRNLGKPGSLIDLYRNHGNSGSLIDLYRNHGNSWFLIGLETLENQGLLSTYIETLENQGLLSTYIETWENQGLLSTYIKAWKFRVSYRCWTDPVNKVSFEEFYITYALKHCQIYFTKFYFKFRIKLWEYKQCLTRTIILLSFANGVTLYRIMASSDTSNLSSYVVVTSPTWLLWIITWRLTSDVKGRPS